MGRRLGYDPTTGQYVNEINPLATDSGQSTEPEVFTIPLGSVIPGQYLFSGVGTGSGPYLITVMIFGEGSSQPLFDQTIAGGVTTPGAAIAPISPIDLSVASSPATLVSITSQTPNGTYGVGARINVTVNFSTPVTLTGGDLTIALNDGGTVTIAPFSDAATATGTYTVAAGDNTPRLDTSSPLVLAASAALTDADGNDAALAIPAGASLANSRDFIIDTSPPTVISPPLVYLSNVVEKTNKKHQVAEVLVTLSGPVNMTEAQLVQPPTAWPPQARKTPSTPRTPSSSS